MYTSYSTVKLRKHYKLDNSKSRSVCIVMKPHWLSSRAFGGGTGCCPCWKHGCMYVSVWELADSLNQNWGRWTWAFIKRLKRALSYDSSYRGRRKGKETFDLQILPNWRWILISGGDFISEQPADWWEVRRWWEGRILHSRTSVTEGAEPPAEPHGSIR